MDSTQRYVFLLWHVLENGEVSEVKFIGAFSSEERAARARQELLDQPGFKDHQAGFQIDRCLVDQTSWEEGFTTWTEYT